MQHFPAESSLLACRKPSHLGEVHLLSNVDLVAAELDGLGG